MAKRPYRVVIVGDRVGYFVKGNFTDWLGQVPTDKNTAEYWQKAGFNNNPQLATYGNVWQYRSNTQSTLPYDPAKWGQGAVVGTEDFQATVEFTGVHSPRIIASNTPALVGVQANIDLAPSLCKSLSAGTASLQGQCLYLEGLWHWDLSASVHGHPTLRLV